MRRVRTGSRLHPWNVATEERLGWLPVSPHPLDWMGPTARAFTAFADADLGRPILELVERVVRAQPERPAASDGVARLSYGELWEGVAGLAEAIRARTPPGELVAILLPPDVRTPVAMLACLGAGRPFLMLDADAPLEWREAALGDARPGLVITRDWLREARTSAPADWRPAKLGADEPACVLFTSGSSGRPKGIVNSQRALLQRVAQGINSAHINAEDGLFTLASPAAIVGVRDILTALVAGASIRMFDPKRAAETPRVLSEEAITILFAMPALMRALVPLEARAPETLRLVRMGGDTITWGDVDRLRGWLAPGSAIQSIYAATEAPMMQCFVHDGLRGEDARVPIGYPLKGNALAVDDCELVVAGPYVALGRWSDGACVPTEACEAGRIFRTGDLVRLRDDGLLERLGRKDRQIKVRGHRVELEGVEAVLRAHRHVRDAGVLARDMGGETMLVAYVSARGGAPATLIEDLCIAMRAAPAAMRPARLQLVAEIPRLKNSKLDVRALAALDAPESVAAGVDASDRVARAVDAAWRDALGKPAADAGEDFFEAGGDSLKAIGFMLALERALGEALPVTLINEAPSFAGLCAALKAQRASGALVTLKEGEADAPPVFIVHGVGGNVVELFPMARRMRYPGAVIGIQARGLADAQPPHASVAAMAKDYLAEIRARRAQGPYHLCGYSFGGLVAFEIARMLKEAGEEVGLVGLFDTMMSPVRWPMRAWLSIIRRRIARIGREAPKRDLLRGAPRGSVRVAASALMASAKYRPGFYDGEITLFSPACREHGLPALAEIWARHARTLRVVEIPGDHATMLSGKNAESAAEALGQELSERVGA